jgi:ubiquinone/menaquinone biosynthesis C-methylase UbiE
MTREDWANIARGWESHADAFRRQTMPVATWMIDHTAPQAGQTVLDLAAGIGDTGFLAAELIEPGGTLITSDVVPEMLSAAQRRAESLGIKNVRFKQIDASRPIDIETASIDCVLCRWAYMLVDDPENALRETRRILRPGGRVALAAWTTADDNPWSSLPVAMLVDRGLVDPVDPGRGGQFAWGEEGIVAEYLEAAGFVEYEVEAIDFPIRHPSVEAWWATAQSIGIRAHDARIPDRDEWLNALATAATKWTQDDGSLAIPAKTWVAAATG